MISLNFYSFSRYGLSVKKLMFAIFYLLEYIFVMQGLEKIYYKKLRYEHHHKNFEESILRDITPSGLRIYKKPGISGISPGFIEQWNAVLKSTERHLVKLLLKESEKVVSSLNNDFEALLLSSFPKDFKVE